MTASIAAEATRRRRIRPPAERRTMAEDLRQAILAQLSAETGIRFPDPYWWQHPVEFFRRILGVEPWAKQIEIIEAIRDYTRVSVASGHKVSKDLDDDTPVPTPRGWVRHGDLRVGDEVFAADGTVARVVSVTPWTGRRMMRVHFEDGTSIDCSESHDWVVRSRELRKPRSEGTPSAKLETRELFESQYVPNGCTPTGVIRTIPNWTVDLPAPLQVEDVPLPLDPYLLGLWLGDGSSSQAVFTSADGLEQAFRDAGFEVTSLRGRPTDFYIRGLLPVLREMGVLNNKHVPDAYLWASERQRRALLAGLLDTDGHVTERGRVTFTNTNRRLADAVLQLARSLGIKARIVERRAQMDGRDCGPVWAVSWASPQPVFRLPRKSARIRTRWSNKKNAHRRIAITRIERLPILRNTQCIEIDHPSHLYLAGESMVPTHNSHTAAGIALCYYSSHEDARVVMSSTTARQVDQILWRELRMMRARAGRCLECKAADPDGRRIPRPCPHSALIEGDIGALARTGLKSDDFREIVGFTAREPEAVAGVSGRNLLYIIDEASGVPDEIFEAIEGNRAGGARIVLFSNPTRTEGEFYESFHGKRLDTEDPASTGYRCIRVSSEETPNVISGKRLIPGLATREWVEEKRREWGEDSPIYKVRVKGEFVIGEDGKIFSIHTITQAEQRWHEDTCNDCGGTGTVAKSKLCVTCKGTGQAPAAGRLFVGLDPAGPTGSGDETVFCLRRGLKMIGLQAHLGLTDDAHVAHLLSLLDEHRLPRETPVVVLDSEGEVGWNVYQKLREHLSERGNESAFELVRVRSSDKAVRRPHIYDRVRDELAANLETWFRDGGMILEDSKLAKDLHVLTWEQAVNGKLKLISKKEIRKQLGRSPDRYDALSLACWEPLSLQDGDLPPSAKGAGGDDDDDPWTPTLDPYAGADTWR